MESESCAKLILSIEYQSLSAVDLWLSQPESIFRLNIGKYRVFLQNFIVIFDGYGFESSFCLPKAK